MARAALLESLLSLLILAPLLLLAWRSSKDRFDVKVAAWFVAIFVVSNLLTHALSGLTLFPGQRYNWVGKGAATIFLLACAFLLPGFRKEQFGLRGTMQWRGSRPLLILCGVYFLLRVGLYLSSGEATAAVHAETALFQATLPGIHEELLYRGLLLGLLEVLFVRPTWSLAKVNVGWPAILTSLLFGLAHGIGITAGLEVHFNTFGFLRTTFDGFLFALLVHETRSLLPAVVYHNLLNLIGNH